MFLANPLLGVGPGCSLVAYPFYVLDGEHCGCTEQLVIHNSFIQMLADLGALGFVPWMIFLGMSFIHTRQVQRRGLNAKYATALELALFGFVVCSLAGGFTYSWFPYILAALIVAMKRMSDAGSGHAAGR
jgi:O-antigen ligase